MRLCYTLFEGCDINLFLIGNCCVNADYCVPLAGCCGHYSAALDQNTDDKSKGVCVSTALTGTAAGEASSTGFVLPFFISPALPLWPLLPNLTLLWEQKLCLENELGTNRAGEKDLPRDPMASQPVRRGRVLPVLSCAPHSSSQVPGSVFHPLGWWWVGRETDPFLFFPLSLFEENLPLVTLLTWDQL